MATLFLQRDLNNNSDESDAFGSFALFLQNCFQQTMK